MEGGVGGKVLRKKGFRCHSKMDLYRKSAMEGRAGGKVLRKKGFMCHSKMDLYR